MNKEKNKIINFLMNLENLSNIKRFNQFPIINPINVAEHGFYCAWWAFLIALYEKKKGIKVNLEKVIIKALTHDTEESITGDILYPVKHEYDHGNMSKILHKASKKLMKFKVLNSIDKDIAQIIYKYWENSKDDTIEGEIVKASDMVDCFIYLIKEINIGNNFMMEIYFKSLEFLTTKYSHFDFVKLIIDIGPRLEVNL